MGLDWDALVLRPNMNVFAVDIIVTPRVSQPNVAPYTARAVWSQKPVDIVTLDGAAIHSSVDNTMGVRLSEFTVPPKEEDLVTFNGVTYTLADVDPDGQGGAKWSLKNRMGEP